MGNAPRAWIGCVVMSMEESILQFFTIHPVWTVYIAVNLLAICLMGVDKLFAKLHLRRIPERILLWVATLFGAAGMFAGMLLFRHKLRKPKFRYGVPIRLLLQVVIFYFILTTNWGNILPLS